MCLMHLHRVRGAIQGARYPSEGWGVCGVNLCWVPRWTGSGHQISDVRCVYMGSHKGVVIWKNVLRRN